VYSWGVIHHSPDTYQCLQELIRVTKPGGTIKVMIYNRHSLFAVYRWIITALFKGKPFRSLSDVLFYDQESLGTKAYTYKEIKKMIASLPVSLVALQARATAHDLLYYKSKPFQFLAYCCASLYGWNRVGFFMTIELCKIINK
jgi:ubiquinone/menaquinone biosynthesis C-methylase UbiE